MEISIRILLAGGVASITYAFLVELLLVLAQRKQAIVSPVVLGLRNRLLVQGAILISLVLVTPLSYFNLGVETLAAALVTGQAIIIAIVLTLKAFTKQVEGTMPALWFYLDLLGAFLGIVGMLILAVGVLRSLVN